MSLQRPAMTDRRASLTSLHPSPHPSFCGSAAALADEALTNVGPEPA
jgi:hypothetical protein